MNKIWRTRDGRMIHVKDMDNQHLLNSYNFLRKKGFIGAFEFQDILNCAPPNGEMASMAWENEILEIMSKPIAPAIDWFLEELDERGIKHE